MFLKNRNNSSQIKGAKVTDYAALSLTSFLLDISKDPDQTLHNAASDQGVHCLLAECSIRIE